MALKYKSAFEDKIFASTPDQDEYGAIIQQLRDEEEQRRKEAERLRAMAEAEDNSIKNKIIHAMGFGPNQERENDEGGAQNILDSAALYSRSIWTDPKATLMAMMPGGEQGSKMEGNILKLKRKKDIADAASGTDMAIDHKVSLALGGTNSPENLQALSKKENDAKADVELMILDKVRKKEIGRKEAAEMESKWRDYVKDVPKAQEHMDKDPDYKVTKEDLMKLSDYQMKNVGPREAIALAIRDPKLAAQAMASQKENAAKFSKATGKSIATYGMDSVADKVSDFVSGADQAETESSQLQDFVDQEAILRDKARKLESEGKTAEAEKLKKKADIVRQSSTSLKTESKANMDKNFGKDQGEFNKKVFATGAEFAVNAGDAITDAMSLGGKFALKSALKTAAKEILEEGGEEVTKAAVKKMVKEGGEKVYSRMAVNIGESAGPWSLKSVNANGLADQVLQNQGKKFAKDVVNAEIKRPFLQGGLQGIYYGGTSSALNSAYEGKDWEQTKAALPGDIAMNVGMQMVPAGLIRALGKVGSRKVADAANTAAGVGTNKRRELMATLQEMGVPGKEISTMTTEQLEKRMATIGMPEAPSGEPTKAPLGIDAPQSEIGGTVRTDDGRTLYLPPKDLPDKTKRFIAGEDYEIPTEEAIKAKDYTLGEMPKSKEEVLREIEELQGELTARYEVTSDAERDLVLQADYALNGMTKDEKGLHELLRKMRVNKAAADPSVLGKDFYHTNWVTDDKGMISVTDQPIKAGSGNEALGQFRIGSGGITVNPEASIAVSRHAETTLPEIFNDRRAPEYTLRHEGSHRDSGWPEGWDRDRMEAANDGLTLIKYVDDKTLTEEQWVKALQDQGISLEDVAAIRGTKWDKSGAEKTNMSWEPDDDFAARQAEIDQASFNEDLGQVDVPVNEKIIQGVTPDNTAARNAVIDAENSLTPEDMSKQQIVDTNVDKMGLDDVSMTADEVSKAGGAATPDQIITLKRGGYTDKEINELRWPDRYHSDELELEHPAFQEPVTPTHMEVATGDPKMPVDPDKLHTDAVDSLAREANELENLDLEADDFEYKKLTPIQKFLSRRQKGRQVFVSAETALAGQGPAGQRGVKIIRDYHTARTQMEAEVLDDIMYFHQNPDIAQKAMEEAAMFDDLGGNVSADGLLYKSILERVRNMQNGAGGKVKYLYNYIPDMLHPDQKVAFKNWVIDNKNTPMLDGKSTVGEEFGRILDQIPESMDVTDENVLRQMKAFSEFERANGDNLPPELKEQYKSFFVQDPVEKLLMYTESNSKAYGQRVAMLEYQKKADALNKANPDKAPVTGNDLFLEDLHKDARAANPKNDRAGEDAQKFFKTMWDRETKPTSNKGLQTLRSMQVLTKMQMAGFTNSTQSVNTIGLNGAGNTAAAGLEVKRALGNPEEMNALLEKAGRWGMDLNPIADELKSSMGRDVIKERVTGKPQKGGGILERYADWMLTINQFKTVERINRLTAMLSTEKKVQGLVDKLNDGQSFSKAEQRYLQLLGISPEEIAAKGFDDEMFGRAVKQGVSLTQFETNPTQLPMFMTNGPIMDGIMTLQKFNVKQGEFLKEVILKEMGHGNFAPAARYLASAIPAGAANMWVKGVGITALVNLALAPFGVKAIQTKDPETALSEVNDVGSALNFATERIGYAGGFGYLDSVQQNWKYKKNLADFGMKMTGPIGSDIAMAFDMGDQLLNQDKNPDVGQNILAEMAKRAPVPFLNSTLRQAIKPYNPGDSTFYDIKDKIGLNSRNAEISEFTKLKKEGKDISESRVAAQIVGKVYDPSTGKIKDYISEKKRNEVLKVIEELGIDKYKALNYGKVQKNEVRKAGKMLTKEEKAIAGMGSEERDQYMRENGLEYSDMPTLVEYLRKKGQFY